MKAEPAADHGIFITHEQAKAVNVLLAAVKVAQEKGAYSFADSSGIYEAIQCFIIKQPEESEVSEDEDQVFSPETSEEVAS